MEPNNHRLCELEACFSLAGTPQEKCHDLNTTCELVETALKEKNIMPQSKRLKRLPGISGYYATGNGLTSYGKGFSDLQAKVSALMEFWERYHWQNYPFQAQNGYQTASFATMFIGKKSFIRSRYLVQNLRTPEKWLANLPLAGKIPLGWLPCWSFTANQELFYPVNWHNACYTSNGLAAGTSLAEALLQGLCEVIERENIWRWLIDGVPAPYVAQESITDAECRQIFQECQEIGCELVIRDISFTADLPCFSVYGLFTDEHGRKKVHLAAAGHGCHPQPLWALKRALSEYLASHDIKKPDNMAKNWHHPYPPLEPLTNIDIIPPVSREGQEICALSAVSPYQNRDLTATFKQICQALKNDGYEVGARILNEDPRLPVVRVLVPGMRLLHGVEIDDYRMILAQMCHEAGDQDSAKKWLLEALDDPSSELGRMAAGNELVKSMLPTILKQMGTSLFFGKTYQDSMKRFDKLSGLLG